MEQGYILCILIILGVYNLEECIFKASFVMQISSVFSHFSFLYIPVKECTVKKNKEGKPLGFAFMTFETSACVDKIQQLRPHTIQGRRVETKRQVMQLLYIITLLQGFIFLNFDQLPPSPEKKIEKNEGKGYKIIMGNGMMLLFFINFLQCL